MRPESPIQFAPGQRAETLNRLYAGATAEDVLHAGLRHFGGEVALVSSFGADSVVLLHMLAGINPHVPVLLVDTLMLFEETLAYQRDLTRHLGLSDVRRIRPEAAKLAAADPFDALHTHDTDACCALRKVAPLEAALRGFAATVSGRKRHQSPTRAAMEVFETDPDGRIKINPLADWSPGQLRAYLLAHDLPRHPLVAKGFPSIGCRPCTSRVGAGEDARAGRWRGQDKIECGIHYGAERQSNRRIA